MPKKIELFLFGFCLMLVMNCTKTTQMPAELLGSWATQATRYEDRYIEIKETELIFGTGAGIPEVFFIEKIKEKKAGEFVEWTFYCKTVENVPTDIVLFYTTIADGVHFELRNKRQVHWVKLKD